MSQHRDQLVDKYADHFVRLNQSLDARAMSAKDFRMHQRTFGEVLNGLSPGARILDLGCGVGFLLNWLARQPGITAVGVDASPTQLEIARRNLPGIDITCADGLEYLRSNPDSFDGIFCTDVLEHIPGTDLCIEWVQAARAALRPGGFFVCRGPNGANLTASYSRYIDLTHERIFTEVSILQLLEAGGLSDGRVLPIRAGGFGSCIRLAVEAGLHRMLYRLCGQGKVRHFTYNVCAVGYCRD
jgi:2-polyprenyl-3-methyl-5-hydroxy-6-metoxy-1,4-benzoquinol methylase